MWIFLALLELVESEFNHGPTLLDFFLVWLIFPFKDFCPFQVLIFKHPISMSGKLVSFWDH